MARKYFDQDKLDEVVVKNTLFHDTILNSSDNPTVVHMMTQIKSQVLAYRSFISSYKFRSTFMDEHWGIFQAIKNREPDKAEELMRKHIMNDYMAIDSQIGNYFNSSN